jgi:hypothetical protein
MKAHYGAATVDGGCGAHQEFVDDSGTRVEEGEVGMLAPSWCG